jgi:CubicO group peptidase (beta-lactamase class C family)
MLGMTVASGLTLGQALETTWADALVVLNRGRVALEWYGSEVSGDDRHIVFSVTKSVTALLAGALAGKGQLDVGALVTDYLPEASRSGFAGATVRDLLDMTANVAFVEDYELAGDMLRYRQAAGWAPGGSGDGLHDFILSLKAAGPHGERFRYLSPVTDTLGWVCERASGATLADGFGAHLWGPMGAAADADLTLDRFGASRAAGGLCMTARDMALVGQLVLDSGAGSVPAEFIADLVGAGDRDRWAGGEFAGLFPGGAYRSCWYQTGPGTGPVAAIGIHGQFIYVDLARRVVVAQQSHRPAAADEDADRAAIAGFGAIAGYLAG